METWFRRSHKDFQISRFNSPLAGETNWMETYHTILWFGSVRIHCWLNFPLVGETNWMETQIAWCTTRTTLHNFQFSPLVGETNWMETTIIDPTEHSWFDLASPLAGETNWMETWSVGLPCRWYRYLPHALGKLIEWKLIKQRTIFVPINFPQALGKLIEWKQLPKSLGKNECLVNCSPLAGETNWMETQLTSLWFLWLEFR